MARNRTTHDMALATSRMLRAVARRIDRYADIEDLHDLFRLERELAEVTAAAVRAAHRDGFTWESIGEAAGTTRQAAHKRWGK